MGRHKKRKRKSFAKLSKHQKGKTTLKHESSASPMFVVNPLNINLDFVIDNEPLMTNFTVFSACDNILLVGETNFNFSRTLIRNIPAIDDILFVSTSDDTLDECIEKYGSDAQFNMAMILQKNGIILHSVDCRLLHTHPSMKQYKHCFTRIIFCFSELYFNTSTIAISDVQIIIREFLHSCKEMLHVNGEIHIVFDRISFNHKWNIENIAKFQCNLNCECVNEKLNISQLLFGYVLNGKKEKKNVRVYKMWMKNQSRNKKRKKNKWLVSQTNISKHFENEKQLNSKSIELQTVNRSILVHSKNPNKKNRVKWSEDEKLKKNQLKQWGLKLRINRKNFRRRKVQRQWRKF